MFRTIGHTFELMKMSWRVLMQDRELIFFPIFGVIGALIVGGIFYLLASGAGTLDRLEEITAASEQVGTTAEPVAFQAADVVLLVLVFIGVYFVTIFFNAALVSAALERLRGGDPNISSGLSHASKHIPAILGWAIISASVGLILMILKAKADNFVSRMVISMIGGVWDLMTFFVVPILVSEGASPFGSIKRSSGLVRQTWGRQITASFGFQLVYLIAGVIAIAPAALLFALSPFLGIAFGVVTVSLAFGIVGALEGIFKAALYEYAMGEQPQGFEQATLKAAYQPDLRVQQGV